MLSQTVIDHRGWAQMLDRLYRDEAEKVIARHIAANLEDQAASVHWCLIREAFLKLRSPAVNALA